MCPPTQTSPDMSDQKRDVPNRTRKRTISTTEIVDKKLSNVLRRLSAPINILIEEIPDSSTQHEVVQKYTQVFTYYLLMQFMTFGFSKSPFLHDLSIAKKKILVFFQP